LTGRSSAFSNIAGSATRNNIGPIVETALNFRDDVIQGEFGAGIFSAAVLTDERVPDENVLSRKGNFATIHLANKLEQPYDGRHAICLTDGSYNLIGFLNYLNFTVEH
jgi:hypothetical protein